MYSSTKMTSLLKVHKVLQYQDRRVDIKAAAFSQEKPASLREHKKETLTGEGLQHSKRMSVLTLSCVVLLLTLQTTIIYSQGGSNNSCSQGATYQEIDGLFNKHYAVLEQLQLAVQEIKDMTSDIMQSKYADLGTTCNPACSCSEIKQLLPNSTSGLYWIRNPMGNNAQQYCDMEREGCGVRGGWMRVAYLDMTQPNQQCPPGFRTITSGKRLCGRPGPPGCVSVKFPTNNIPYRKVCGKVIAYQDKTTDGQCPYIGLHTNQQIHTLEEVYIDGVSITHSTPRQHIWSFIASHGENFNDCHGCPCYSQFTGTRVPFIGDSVFCDSGTETWHGIYKLYSDDPLWDGQGCGSNSNCCSFNNPPWFCTEFNQPTSDDIELRLCADQPTRDEDIPIEHIELYVQ